MGLVGLEAGLSGRTPMGKCLKIDGFHDFSGEQ